MQNTSSEAGIPLEIERKFLLPYIPEFMTLQPSDEIKQGYVPDFRIYQRGDEYFITLEDGGKIQDELELIITKEEFENLQTVSIKLQPNGDIIQGYLPNFRIREKGEAFFITKKYGGDDCGGTQPELEFPITKEEFELFWKIGEEVSLSKKRHYLEVEGKCFEGDKFKSTLDPLCMSEVEFNSTEERDSFIPPKFFGPEVTHDKRFSNYNLAKNGINEAMLAIIKRVQETMKNIEPAELNLEDGVNWIVKGVENLMKNKLNSLPVIANISGGSGSGKTSKVTLKAKQILEEKGYSVEILSMDNFYHGPTYMDIMEKSGNKLNYDQPEAYDMKLLEETLSRIQLGSEVLIPSYDFQNDPVKDSILINKSQVILVEGLFALNEGILNKSGDLKIFVDVSSHGRVIRRLLRDAGENGRSNQTPNSVLHQILETVEPMDKIHVQPQTKNAHIIINNDHNPLIESSNLNNKIRQAKFNISDSCGDNIILAIESLGFTKDTEIKEVDFYYNHEGKDLIETGEVFRIRRNETKNTTTLSYKFPEQKDNHRNESTYSFDIDNQIEELIDSEYSEIGCIIKNRLTLIKDNIHITIDMNVIGQFKPDSTVYKKIELGNFIEIKGCKDEEEMNYYIDLILSLISKNPEDILISSYINMLIEKKK